MCQCGCVWKCKDTQARRHIDGLECGPPRRRGRVYTHRCPCAEAFVCTDTAYSRTTVWPDMFYVLVEAVLEEEIHCDDVRGIGGGCATLPRRGDSVYLTSY